MDSFASLVLCAKIVAKLPFGIAHESRRRTEGQTSVRADFSGYNFIMDRVCYHVSRGSPWSSVANIWANGGTDKWSLVGDSHSELLWVLFNSTERTRRSVILLHSGTISALVRRPRRVVGVCRPISAGRLAMYSSTRSSRIQVRVDAVDGNASSRPSRRTLSCST